MAQAPAGGTSMSARDDIFTNIRRSLGVSGKETTRHAAVAQRLADTPRGPIPARGQGSPAGRLATFIGEATRVSATVVVLDTAQAVPEEIARFLRDAHLPLTLKHGEDARLSALDWQAAGLEVSTGHSDGADLNAVSHAFGGPLHVICGHDPGAGNKNAPIWGRKASFAFSHVSGPSCPYGPHGTRFTVRRRVYRVLANRACYR
jgi:hypothetical protein